MTRALRLIVAALAVFVPAAQAQVAPASQPAPIQRDELTVHPALPPVPALRYRFAREYGQQMPGNGAPQYLIALELLPTAEELKPLYELLDAPTLNVEEAKKIVTRCASLFRQLDIAGQREECLWNLPLREQGVNTLLPHLGKIRQAAEALALNARLEIYDGKYDDAVRTLAIGFALGQSLRNDAGLVQGLVAVAIDTLFLDRVAELQQKADAPNLYWALSTLPQPLVDRQGIAGVERSWLFAMFPELRGKRIESLTEDDLRSIFHKMAHLSDFDGEGARSPTQEFQFAGSMVVSYQAGKRRLIEQGKPPEEVSGLPAYAVITPYLLNDYTRWDDELHKWAGLPYAQSRAGLERLSTQMQGEHSLQGNPLMIFTPALNRAFYQFAHADRLVARVQSIEALRAYAAAHDGQLPASLDDLSDTPAPLDPITGKAFGYERNGNVATLHLAAVSAPEALAEKTIQISVR